MISKIKELIYRMEPVLPQHEEEYRKAYYYSDLKQVTIALIIFSVAFIFWMIKETLMGGELFFIIATVISRLAVIVMTIIFLIRQKRSLEAVINERLLFFIVLFILIQQLLTMVARPVNYSFTSFTSFLLIFFFYFVVTFSLPVRLGLSVILTAFDLFFILFYKEYQYGGKFTIVVTYITINIMSTVYSSRINTTRRKNYLDFIRLKNAKEKMDAMYRSVAHDIRAPFSGLISYSDILNSLTMKNAAKGSERIRDVSAKMRELIYKTYFLTENLLEWAGSETINSKSKKSRFILEDSIRDSVDLFMPMIEQKKIDLVINSSQKITLNEDTRAFNALVRNLVHNAAKFTPVNGKISVSVIRSKNSVMLEIFNSGRPISVKTAEESRKRSSGIMPDSKPGRIICGMGLGICYNLAKKNSWGFSIAPIKGRGTLVRIIIKHPDKEHL